MRHYPMVNVRDVVDEPTANEPGHRRLSTEDYWRLLSEQMGQIATEQAQIRRAIEQAQTRYARVTFMPDEISAFPSWPTVSPTGFVQKPIPVGDWSYVAVVQDPVDAGSLDPVSIILDGDAYIPPTVSATYGGSTQPFYVPIFGQYSLVALMSKQSVPHRAVTAIFTNRDIGRR